jgi:signal transduction histidine kinase
MVCACGLLLNVTALCVQQGWQAFSLSRWSSPYFVFVSGVPGLVLTPFFLASYGLALRSRFRPSALWMAWGVFLFSLLISIPCGVYAIGWSVQPLIVLLVTCLFGVRPGLAQASLGVLALLASASLSVQGLLDDVLVSEGIWVSAGVTGAVIVGMALAGALLHRTLDVAITAEEEQVYQIDQAKRALRHRENLLRHAMRVETVGEMSSMVVHQLRNQFQLILGYTALGQRSSDAVATEQFAEIAETIRKSNDLLESLLGLARSQGGEVQSVDLRALCVQLAESYSRVLPASIELVLDVPDEPAHAMLDPQGLEHAVLNLVLNARQAMVGDGQIRLGLRVEPEQVVLEVEDTGSGIEESDVDQVFRPFFTTKEKGKGTGLGLAAVERFVRASKGDIGVKSQPGVGTVFSLAFPRVGSPEISVPAH